MDDDLRARIDLAVKALLAAGAEEVYLFGSVAEGRARPDSDVDIAVKGLPAQVYYRQIGELMGIVDRPVSLVDLDEDTPFVAHLREWGKLHRVA